MSEQFEHLFKPITIGPVEIRNRICFSAHSSGMTSANAEPTPDQTAYYAERAKGGAGWMVIGASQIHDSALQSHVFNNVNNRNAIAAYRELTDAVHEHGAKISTQIDHMGKNVEYPRYTNGYPLLAPSAIADPGFEMPKEAEVEDLERVIRWTVESVEIAGEAGFDGVELLWSMGWSLGQQFMSPLTNKRTDEYGGSLENRLRFPLQLLEAVHDALGPNMFAGIKLTADEMAEGGLSQDDLKDIAKRLVDTGHVDYLHVDVGSAANFAVSIPEMTFPAGFATYLAAGIREVVDVPVVAVKRINDPIIAEQVLADGQADIIAMARALITDPELPNKARNGEVDDIRLCTGSNQECCHRLWKNLRMGCVHNPAAGNESRWGIGTLQPAAVKKRIMVVGGGPAGMKLASVAAERGHEVELHERSDALGGQVQNILAVQSRKDYESILRYLRHRIDKLGVDVHLNSEVSPDAVRDADFDTVVIATGARPQVAGEQDAYTLNALPGADGANVLSVFDVFNGDESKIGEKVVIVDDYQNNEGLITTEYLLDQGKQVEVVTQLNQVGFNVDGFTWGGILERFAGKPITMTPLTLVSALEPGVVRGMSFLHGEWETNADSVVLIGGKSADDSLYMAAKEAGLADLHRIGDCVAPRRVTDAIWEGNELARAI